MTKSERISTLQDCLRMHENGPRTLDAVREWVRFVIFTFRPTGFVVITSSDSLSGDPEFFG